MSTYQDPFIAEAKAQANKLFVESVARLANIDARLADCDRRVKKVEAMHRDDQEHFRKAETLLAEHYVAIHAPQVLEKPEKLPIVELKLRVAEYEQQRKVDECKRLELKHLDAHKTKIRLKKENKQLTKTVESLTAQLESKASPQEQALKTENDEFKEQLALLKAQVQNKTEECEAKDAVIASKEQDIVDLRDDFAAYHSVTSDTWSHRHDSCNELVAALEEQCDMLTTERNILKGNLNTFHHKNNTLTIERDNLQGRFDVSNCTF